MNQTCLCNPYAEIGPVERQPHCPVCGIEATRFMLHRAEKTGNLHDIRIALARLDAFDCVLAIPAEER